MTRENLAQLASEAQRFEKLTQHLKINGLPLKSLKLQLQNDELHDPLRQKLADKQSTACG